MFSQASVILFTGGGGVCPSSCWDTPRWADNPPRQTPPRQTPPGRPPPRDGHCSGWYASYWNAFLFIIHFTDNLKVNRMIILMKPVFRYSHPVYTSVALHRSSLTSKLPGHKWSSQTLLLSYDVVLQHK